MWVLFMALTGTTVGAARSTCTLTRLRWMVLARMLDLSRAHTSSSLTRSLRVMLVATTRSSTKAADNLVGDNFDAGAIRHSEKIPQVSGQGSKYTSVEGDNHEDPSTGSHMITYSSRGNG
jgi:hypothetical protein